MLPHQYRLCERYSEFGAADRATPSWSFRDQIERRGLPYHETLYGLLVDRLGTASYQRSHVPDLPPDAAWASDASNQRILVLHRHCLTVAVSNETDYPMDLAALNHTIAEAIAASHIPFCRYSTPSLA